MRKQRSTVNKEFDARLVEVLDSAKLINGFSKSFDIDVSRFVSSSNYFLYQCERTGLKFYRGVDAGDSHFYEELMKFPWYYLPWKWEHQIVADQVQIDQSLLEIGSGNGGFLSGITNKVASAFGLELNETAVSECIRNGLNVYSTDLTEFTKKNLGSFDWVVSFQVLEHVTDVDSFITNSLKLLKTGGRMVISVPNNQSFISLDQSNWLNHPPHHMNLWDEASLMKMADIYGCSLVSIEYEPLQRYHFDWYISTVLSTSKQTALGKIPLLRRVLYKSWIWLLKSWLEKEAANIKGHSLLIIVQK